MLELKDCKNLVHLPNSICNLKSLKNLNISGCSKLSRLLNTLNEIDALEELDGSETAIREVPSSLHDSKSLKKLAFGDCAGLLRNSWSLSLPNGKVSGFGRCPLGEDFKLPPLSGFSTLKELDLSYCNLSDGSIPDDIGRLSSLEDLQLYGNNFFNLPTSIANLSRLGRVDLFDCPRLQTLPVIPSSVRLLFVQNCTQMAPIIFDPQIIWKSFEEHRWHVTLWFIIPGSEIPAWFVNQDYFPFEQQLTDRKFDEDYGSIVSIIVDIPDYCWSSEWWGFAVCLSLHSTMIPEKDHGNPIEIRWACKVPDTNDDYPLHLGNDYGTHFSGHHLFILIFGSDRCISEHHLMDGQKKVQLVFCAEDIYHSGKLKIRNFGCRVLCKEDAQVWCRGREASQVGIPSNANNDSSLLKQSRITEITDEIKEDEAIASDFAKSTPHPG